MTEHVVAEFMSIFKGSTNNYGEHKYGPKPAKGEKREGTSKTVKNKLVTIKQHTDHLDGKTGLGIIPIDEQDKCNFCVIDVDIYGTDMQMYVDAIEQNHFPIVPFRSKSGGLHLYIFFNAPISASHAISVTRQLSTMLSIDAFVKEHLNKIVEIFPKQYKIEQGNVGSWINLPYFNAKHTQQYAIRGNETLSLEAALAHIKNKRHSLKDIKDFIGEQPFSDGPPCLQSIHTLNPIEKGSGGRNVYLFTFGVYLKKKDESFWEQRLYEINQRLPDPLDDDELERTILSSLRKKDYSYKCYEHPCATYCNRPVCKTREFGIGKEGGYFSELEYGQMFQVKTMQPYYEWEVKQQEADEYTRLRFYTEDEIIKQDSFLRLCFRMLRVLPTKLKQPEWFKIVNQSLADIQIVEVSTESDTSTQAMLRDLFAEFLIQRSMAETKDQIMIGRVFFDVRTQTLMFRNKAFLDWLFSSKNFRYYTPIEIHGFLKDTGVVTTRVRTELGKQIRISTLKYKKLEEVRSKEDEPDFEANFAAGEGEEF